MGKDDGMNSAALPPKRGGTPLLSDTIRELAGLLGHAGRDQAAAMLDDEANSIAAGVTPRGLSALRRVNALRAGMAAATDAADHLDHASPEKARLRALVADIGRALSN